VRIYAACNSFTVVLILHVFMVVTVTVTVIVSETMLLVNVCNSGVETGGSASSMNRGPRAPGTPE